MTQSISDALINIKDITESDSALATLMDFERVIDELDVYAFKNWKSGELVSGPEYEKYFVTATFMWPRSKMPDPRGGEQLLNYNCEILYKKDELEYPIKPKSPEDFKPGTKLAKTKKVPIWLVTVTIPKKLMTEIQRGAIEIENEKLDLQDLDQSYDEGVDEESTELDQQTQMDGEQQDQMGGGMGGDQMGGPGGMQNAQQQF